MTGPREAAEIAVISVHGGIKARESVVPWILQNSLWVFLSRGFSFLGIFLTGRLTIEVMDEAIGVTNCKPHCPLALGQR